MSDIETLLADLRTKVPEELAELEHQREEITQRINMLRGLQRTFNPTSPAKPQRKRTSNSNSNGTGLGVSPEIVLKIAEAINDIGDDTEFTALQLHHEILGNEWVEPSTYKVLKEFKEMEYIAKQGKDAKHRDLFVVLDSETITQIREKYGNA